MGAVAPKIENYLSYTLFKITLFDVINNIMFAYVARKTVFDSTSEHRWDSNSLLRNMQVP